MTISNFKTKFTNYIASYTSHYIVC